ncbi:uncharacterized protein LOC122402459 [Colletes gigas]|uniref:uncharacterized protein LOC122402459 n=1 Tax=Colletes gigas TaxID=935657 RepID=UPI001C9AFC67|nr:uncharacterized protein LOC122402459 [Colletes gigas]
MSEHALDAANWLDHLIPKVTANLDNDFDDARYDLLSPDDTFFVSSMCFVKIIANSSRKDAPKDKSLSVVVKKPPQSVAVREMLSADAQFHNEILFYRKYAMDSDEFPRFIYADEKPPTDTVLVLENIGQWGYSLCQWRYNVPVEYTLAAFREIARFHAKGYVMKQRRREEFFKLVGDIWESRYDKNPDNGMKLVIKATATRAVDYLRDHGHDKLACDKLEAYLDDAYENIVLKSIEPEEPLSTLCHGDFTLNNTFFKRENGQVKAMFIDFALMRYGSPIIDLTTFLCLHCAENLDKEMLDTVLRAYHDSLEQRLAEDGIEDCDKFSYESLREEYKRKGLLGFIIASFFLALLMGKSDQTPEEFAELDVEVWTRIMRELGGDEISEILANLLLKMQEFGCLDHVM